MQEKFALNAKKILRSMQKIALNAIFKAHIHFIEKFMELKYIISRKIFRERAHAKYVVKL